MTDTIKIKDVFGPNTGHEIRLLSDGLVLTITTTSPNAEMFIREDALTILKAFRDKYECSFRMYAPNAGGYLTCHALEDLPEKEVQDFSGVTGIIVTPADFGYARNENGAWVLADF